MNMYKTAIQIQDACNLQAVARELVKVIDTGVKAEGHIDTQSINEHPVVKLIVDKLADLANIRSYESFCEAYDVCKMKAD